MARVIGNASVKPRETEIPAHLKGADEVHVADKTKNTHVFFIKDGKAFYRDGRPVEPETLFLCPYCKTSPPAFSLYEKDIVEHVIKKHPKEAAEASERARKKEEAKAAKKTTKKSKKSKSKKSVKKTTKKKKKKG